MTLVSNLPQIRNTGLIAEPFREMPFHVLCLLRTQELVLSASAPIRVALVISGLQEAHSDTGMSAHNQLVRPPPQAGDVAFDLAV